MSRIDKLLSISSEALHSGTVEAEAANPLAQQHFALLRRRNGFVAFESALLVRPVGGPLDVLTWNEEGWRQDYGSCAEGLFFFAEDIFGGQFAIDTDQIVTFDPETGERERLASNLEEWAGKILDDYDYLTGYSLAHEWQQQHSTLPLSKRLMPRVPFVTNGEFSLANLVEIGDRRRMVYGAMLASRIGHVHDGEQLTLPY